MERMDIVCLKSDLMSSGADLGGSWNSNQFQKERVQRVAEIIDDHLVSRTVPVEYEGRTLVAAYKEACSHLGKDPYDFAKNALALVEAVQLPASTLEDRKELIAFYNVVTKCFDRVLGK